mmetsp:Transcript_6371/g.8764  ORF Transcript_6371/g.8764 Transcript_6371/m.8764 type:complete len:221 (-) Transcript_6371:408-1070(-)
MILEPGSFAGMLISPIPHRGPELRRRTSLATFMREQAIVLSAPEISTSASLAASASNLFGAEVKGYPVMVAICLAMASLHPLEVLRPVPTAVPPIASSHKRGRHDSTRLIALATCWAYPPNSCPRVSGVASCQCVRPHFIMSLNSLALASKALWRRFRPGSSTLWTWVTAAMCMAVGKVSLLDWPMFTWSLGWTGFLDPTTPPRIWMARFEMTSFEFMLV